MALGFDNERKIGELLMERGYVTPEKLQEAVQEQKKKPGQQIGDALLALKHITEEQLLEVLSDQLGLPYLDVNEPNVIDKNVILLLPENICKRFKLVACRKQGETLYVAMVNPRDIVAMDTVKQIVKGVRIQPLLALEKHVMKAIEAFYAGGAALSEVGNIFKDQENVEIKGDSDEKSEGVDVNDMGHESAPVIKYVNAIFAEAVKTRASDIHIEAFEKELRVRFRIDGALQEKDRQPAKMKNSVAARMKVISGLDIAERRLPQDGRTKVRIGNKDIDIRVSVLPMIHGEKIVMRLLDKSATSLNINDMGMEPHVLEKCKKLCERPYGIILLCGPTGSGKTTTLYSFLSYVNQPDINITTVENPVEYQLPGINQCQVRQEIGLTFAAALRSILRQDPDIVMVGEIRDQETLEMSVKAALTGHLVFSTIHTNNACATVQRMLNMGAEPFMISSTLTAAISQRLVRKICKDCKRQYQPEPDQVRALQEQFKDPCDFKFFKGQGCANCSNTGNRGRAAVHELYFVNSVQRDLIARRATEQEITVQAKKDGMETLVENAFRKVRNGMINIEECLALFYNDDEI